MRVTLDRQTDTIHLYFTSYEDADVAREYMVVEHDVRGDFALVFDKRGVVLGIEVNFASSAFPQEFLAEAEPV
jgi:hypothetical protein